MKGIDKTQSVAPDAFARTGKQGGTAVSDSSAAPGDTRFQTNSYRSWVPNPEDMIDNEAFGIARNAFYESKLEMPHPLIPVNGTGFQPEPVLPEYMYPHEVRCPAGWLAYGPHCITIVAVPVWTTCPGDRSFKRHGLRSRMAVASPGICAVTVSRIILLRETGVSLVCPGGYEPHFSEVLAFTPNDVENGKTGKSNEPIGHAFTCTQLDSIPIAVAAGDHCPPGYSISDVGTCEARKQVGPSVSCPEGFVLGGEQTSPYAILSQEFAKCGAVEYYLGKVWCPDGFLPLGIDLPNLPFGSSLDAFGTVDRIAQAAEANRLSPSPRSLKRMEDTNSLQRKKAKIHKVASELRSVFPDSFVDVLLQNTLSEMHVEAETNPLDEEEMQQEGSWKEDAKSEGHRTDQGMDELEIGETLSDDMEEDINEDVWIVDDTEAEMEVDYELADNFDFQLKADSQRSPTNEASLQTQGRQSATEGSPISKLNSEAIPSSLASFEETTIKQAQARGTTPAVHPHRNVSSESQQGTGETLNRDGETGGHSGRKRRSEVRRKRRMQEQRKTSEGVQATPNLIMQLEAKIPPGGACVHIVGVFEGHCDKIECHGGIMKKIHQLVYDWVDYRLRVDIRQVDMFIPNGRDFRRTTPG
ncbi:hypothetical protein TGP89_208760 [Toxoplasma gondii p89]|uniref:Uncharacterized protein n=1 Tax=Toxoplasma gondii p89 TaxID=943119 RepID=A0A086JAY5_TOXGO|nr:hypothetical protein TGP89_208760 [Toxoplasma gondii p89]